MMKSLKVILHRDKDDKLPKFSSAIPLNEIDSVPDSSFNFLDLGILDYVSYGNREELISKSIKKLRIGGEIFIQCNEYDAIIRSLQNSLFQSPKSFNSLLYDGGRVSIDSLRNIIDQVGKYANVTNVGYSENTCWIKANRNE